MKEIISIILPIYNTEKYLKKCIQSVLNQTYKHFELIIINDGSLDNSLEIAQSYDDARIKLYNKINTGVSDSRNFGLTKVTGEYIYFLDSDDWIEPNLLEVCIKNASNKKNELIVFGYQLDKVNEKEEILTTNVIKQQSCVINKNENGKSINEEIIASLGFVWNKFYKTSLFKKKKLQFNKNISLFEDILFNLTVFKNINEITFIDDVLYHYVDRPEFSLSKKHNQHFFLLSKNKNKNILKFLVSWKFNLTSVKKTMASLIYKDTKHYINSLFLYDNHFSEIQKLKLIYSVLKEKSLRQQFQSIKTTTKKDKIYLFLIKNRLCFPIYLINKILK